MRAGVMGPGELTALFEGKFLLEADRCLRNGHSVSSAVNELLGKAQWLMPHEPPTTVALGKLSQKGSTSSSTTTAGDAGASPRRPYGGLKPSKNGRLEDGDGKVTAITLVEFEKQKKHLEGQLSDARAKVARLGAGRPRFAASPPQGGGGYNNGGGGGDQYGGDRGGDRGQRR